jgi:hypothetical protein
MSHPPRSSDMVYREGTSSCGVHVYELATALAKPGRNAEHAAGGGAMSSQNSRAPPRIRPAEGKGGHGLAGEVGHADTVIVAVRVVEVPRDSRRAVGFEELRSHARPGRRIDCRLQPRALGGRLATGPPGEPGFQRSQPREDVQGVNSTGGPELEQVHASPEFREAQRMRCYGQPAIALAVRKHAKRARATTPKDSESVISFSAVLSGADIFYVNRYLVAWKKIGAAKQIESIRSRTPP